MKDYLFEFTETGENFFVECGRLDEAYVILASYGIGADEIEYITSMSPEHAEMYGYDTY